MGNYYGMDTIGWYDFARLRGFTGTPEQLMDLMIGNISALQDHSAMRNREESDQHPISAISGLQEELNRLDDAYGASGVTVSGWKVVEVMPVKIANGQYTEIKAAAENYQYFEMPDEIDVRNGIYEIEMMVIGLSKTTTTSSADPLIYVGICDRSIGVEFAEEMFAVSATVSLSSKDVHTVYYHAILDGDYFTARREGYVLGDWVSDQTQKNAVSDGDGEMRYANTVFMRVPYSAVNIRTSGIIFRYRKIAQGG